MSVLPSGVTTGPVEIDERRVEPEDDLVLMLGLERDRVVFHRGLDASLGDGWGASTQ